MPTALPPSLAEIGEGRPAMVARVARALRVLAAVRGWPTVVNRLVPQHRAPFVVKNGEITFAGNLGSFVDRQVYLFGGYESERIASFVRRLPPRRRGTILDIGANAGTHSLAFAKVFERVEAFEPNPMLWQQFERNVSLNGLSNVRLHRVGLSDRDDELMLHLIDKPNLGLGTFSTVEQYDLPLRPHARCTVCHGGTFLESVGVREVSAIKVDVQGYEPEVLRGLVDVLERDKPAIWCEIAGGTITKMHSTDDLRKLVPFAFRCFRFGARGGMVEVTGELSRSDYLILPIS